MIEPLSTRLNPFGIYVHIPFCIHKCSYCDFYSFTKFQEDDKEVFVQNLIQEIETAADFLQSRDYTPAVTSVFFGGGTPSLLSAPLLGKIFRVLEDRFPIGDETEVTLEANPETLSTELVRGWKTDTPINRVSLGAQSFQAKHLLSLERLASRQSVVNATEILRDGGFDDFNLDLIVGIPGQTLDELVDDIRIAVSLGPTHLSNYNLTLKPGHPLFAKLADDEEGARCYVTARDFLEENGFTQYEISNYSKPGHRCQHNLLYWSGGDFLGLGPSASSRFFWDGVFHHRKQAADMGQYAKQLDFKTKPFEVSTSKQTALEAVFLELRTREGIELDEFQSRYQFDLRQAPKFNLLKREGLILETDGFLSFSKKGQLLADTIATELAP